MVRHYFSVALLNFRKTPFATLANMAVLALGLTAFVAAYAVTDSGTAPRALRERQPHVRDHQPHGARGRHRGLSARLR